MAIRSSQVRERILAALSEDSRTSNAVIEVIDDNGLVTLRGTVASNKVRQAAEKIADKQEGVISVANTLKLERDEPQETPDIVVPPPVQNQ